MDIRRRTVRALIALVLLGTFCAAGQTSVAFAAGGSMNGAAVQMPAFYDGELFTVNMKEMPSNAEASLLGRNPSVNMIFASNDLDEEQDFMPVIDAIQGDGSNQQVYRCSVVGPK